MFELQCNEACKTNGEMEVPLEATTEATQDNQDNVPQVGKRSYHLCIVCTFLSDSCVVGENVTVHGKTYFSAYPLDGRNR